MKLKYRPEIDGVRAIAVVSVILFHAGFSSFSGGFIGVDVFFVISGYLITSIILNELSQNKFSIINFYERRARRIIPMIMTVMAFSFICAWFILLPTDMELFSKSLIGVSTFISNIFFWKESGYWDLSSELKPLLHTWTLSLEEQFYLLFPLLMILTKKLNKKWLLILIILITFISLQISQWASTTSELLSVANFYLLPTRAWELTIGSLISIFHFRYPKPFCFIQKNRIANEIASISGIILILYAVFLFDQNTPFPSYFALIPTLGTALIIIFATDNTFANKILSLKPMVTIGLISYSAYLWHQPIFAFLRYISFPEPNIILLISLTTLVFPISYLSWRFIENPFRNKQKFKRKTIFTITIIGSTFFITLGVIGQKTDGYKNRDMVSNLNVRNYVADNQTLRNESWKPLILISSEPTYGAVNNDFDKKSWFNKNDPRLKLLIVGNSHGKDIFNTLSYSKFAKENFQIARYGDQIEHFATQQNSFYSSPNYIDSDIIMFASRYSRRDIEVLPQIFEKIEKDNKKIVFVHTIFKFSNFGNRNTADFYIQNELQNKDTSAIDYKELRDNINLAYYNEYTNSEENKYNKEQDLNLILEKHPEVIALDRMDYICDMPDKKCFALDSNLSKYFYDYGHNTIEGAKFYGKRIDEIGWLNDIPLKQ